MDEKHNYILTGTEGHWLMDVAPLLQAAATIQTFLGKGWRCREVVLKLQLIFKNSILLRKLTNEENNGYDTTATLFYSTPTSTPSATTVTYKITVAAITTTTKLFNSSDINNIATLSRKNHEIE